MANKENSQPTAKANASGSAKLMKPTGGTPKTAGKTNNTTKQVLADQNAELAGKIKELEARLARENAARAVAERAVQEADAAKRAAEENIKNMTRSDHDGQTDKLIPWPTTANMRDDGRGRLMRAMGLEDARNQYISIQGDVHLLCAQVGLDFRTKYVHQPAEVLSKIFKLARREHPYLKQFQNDWATAEITKQYLQNKRKQSNHKRKAQGEGNSSRCKTHSHFDVSGSESEEEAKSSEHGSGDENNEEDNTGKSG
ncbi:uncharacterized protein F5891DRAFT_1190322 [Suillus fuscotomentosus]|uniref:Uncharacterized protein n=1 Tax=Suillus fuscotomentosus TaxID=1912939 RepID=A0AAD4E338_9AGAM|nr:uncharacterized protein F5891DRAFT_1190322 [Suillus fuscotomentosus]KAG1898840.1 hypothetical protein F5891DRAFT_1190322 [Suillus fuscotomentosus]